MRQRGKSLKLFPLHQDVDKEETQLDKEETQLTGSAKQMSEVYHMTTEDVHRNAVEYADTHTRAFYGEDSVPTQNGTKAHEYWRSQYYGYLQHWYGDENP